MITGEPKRISSKVASTISAIMLKKIQRSTTYTVFEYQQSVFSFLLDPEW
jgi:hypothetical protein